MKFSYSLIKKFLPRAPSKEKLVDALNMHSFEADSPPFGKDKERGDAFEVVLPPNRYSDAASHIGIAREAGAVFGLKFRNPARAIVNPPENKGFIKVDIKNPELCPRYAARYFELKNPVGQSPKWMQEVLRSCGLKPVNNIVDIMNYAMLETGQPLHAFDADKFAKSKSQRANRVEILVRRAKKGEKVKTLDGKKFTLDKDILVVADKEKPLAIAGIKGGEDSGVGAKTKRIVVEAANFDSVSVYKAAKKLKLQTDASLRFGHGISPALVDWGLDRATELLLRAGAWLLDTVDAYPKPARFAAATARRAGETIEFSPARYEALIGAAVEPKKAEKYFAALGFSAEPPKRKTKDPAAFLVRIPAWRTDIENQEDLVEEIARLEGYGKPRPRAPIMSVSPAREEDVVVFKDKVRGILLGLRLDEVYNSTFVGGEEAADGLPAAGKPPGANVTAIEVENPIAEDKKYLRPSLIPLLMKSARDNARFYDVVRIFEVGKVFSAARSGASEKLSLGIVLAAKKDPKLILEAKGIADELMRGLGIDDFSIVAVGDSLRIEAGHSVLGVVGHAILEKGWYAALAEFDLDKTMQFTEEAKEFIPLKRFPSVLRDVSVLVSPDVRTGDVIQDIQLANPKLIENVDLVDEYVNEKLGGRQSFTFRIIFQADDRTLTDEEVNREMEKIATLLKKEYEAEIR